MLRSAVKAIVKKVVVTAAIVIGERAARKVIEKFAEKRVSPPAPESGASPSRK